MSGGTIRVIFFRDLGHFRNKTNTFIHNKLTIKKGAEYEEEDKQDLIRRYNEEHLM